MLRYLVLTVLLLLAGVSQAQVGISPSYFDLGLDEASQTHAFRLFNYSKDDKAVKVSVQPWDFDSAGAVRLLPPSADSLDQWMVVNPVQFTIKAGSSQVIRFSVRPAVKLADGEHRAMLIFDELLGAPKDDTEKKAMRARFQFRSAVYCQVGPVTRRGTLRDITPKADGFSASFDNVGSANVRLAGQYSVWQAAKFPGTDKAPLVQGAGASGVDVPAGVVLWDQTPGDPALAGSSRIATAKFNKPLAPGKYVLYVQGTLGDVAVKESRPFSVGGH